MIVCICKGVSDRKIRQCVEDGARSWQEVQQETGCATQCGKCACVGKAITHEAIKAEVMASIDDLAYAV